MSNKELIKLISAKKIWILLTVISVVVISVVYYIRTPFSYQSEVRFFVTDDDAEGLKFQENDPNKLILAKATDGNRLYHLAKSTKMLDYLISKFNLYDHYNIDRNAVYHYESAINILRKSIIVQRSDFNSIAITVKDFDKIIAAEMANEIVSKLDEMNRDFIITNIEKKIKIYDQLIRDIKIQSLEQADELRKLIDECSILLTNHSFDKKQENPISDLKIKLAVLSSQLSNINEDFLKTKKMYEISAASIQKENLPSLQVINVAIPDMRSPSLVAIKWTLALSVLAAFVSVGLIYFAHEYKYRIEALFS